MKQIILHIKAISPSILSINNLPVGVINNKNNLLHLEVNLDDEIYLTINPIKDSFENKKLNSYSAKLDLYAGKLISSNKLVTVTSYPNSNYAITLNPNLISTYQSMKVLAQKSFSIKNTTHTATCYFDGLNQILIESGSLLLTKSVEHNLTSCEINKIKGSNVIVFSADTLNGDLYVLIASYNDGKYDIIKEGLFNKLEVEEKEITLLKKAKDIAGSAMVTEIEIDNDKINEKENYTVYLNEKPKEVSVLELIPIAFLQAVKLNNIELAKSYLSEELKAKLSLQHLKSYFGDFKEVSTEIYGVNKNNCVALIYEDGESLKAKIFKVSIVNNKIHNFDEAK